MTVDTTTQTFALLDNIRAACTEIQHALNEHLEKTGNDQYVTYIQRDLVLLDNIKHITHAVRSDMDCDKVGAGTELLLRVAANDFRSRLDLIPEKKAVVKELVRHLKDLHGQILQYTHRKDDGRGRPAIGNPREVMFD